MTDTERLKLVEDIRFQIERMMWKVEIENRAKIQSFTVKFEKGTVKSVHVKIIDHAEVH